ncbi:GNAT family N-acetyltransferase [Candidatus Entotheonella palauensis]|uniref:Nitrilase n=1 Tax=Candidatus Entotheonella gemina TaxID=1429439 RepID=W4MDV2_9BACT|nr:GNAT family N-acetyltransferase [Candidatus Entotheonella palauensis]ETX08121.1 MAG: nitrilase [Candidatus Entotheonella gemina]
MIESFRVVNSQPEMAKQLEHIQRASFPNLDEGSLITAAHYQAHIAHFPEGQFAVLNDTGMVVACSTDFRTTVDFAHYEHSYLDAVDHNWLTHHDPGGDWLYGADIGVLPAYRRRGIARMLYDARQALIRRLGLRGHVAGGLLAGYGQHKDRMSIEAYVDKVKTGELFDPTVSVQLKVGFVIHGIINHYVDDPSCDNKAAFIVWHNPDI